MQYLRPDSLGKALSLLGDLGERGTVLAGGTFFVPHRRELFTDVEAVVDLQDLGLDYIRLDDQGLKIGATTCLTAILDSGLIKGGPFRVIAETVAQVTPLELRNRATIGGDLCMSAESDLPTTLIALNAELAMASDAGTRRFPLEQFYLGYLHNALEAGEIVVEVRVPLPPSGSGAAFHKFKRRAIDLPVLNACAQVVLDSAGACTSARIVLGCASPIPVRATRAEQVLVGSRLDDESIVRASEATGNLEYQEDLRASSEVRRTWGRVAVREVLREALGRAKGGR
ncbi:MAG: FAD binding domain-containing protein [Dehalococcoidia bacterium]|nr:FAD binding domain-containing protein [Dehalococcoidia bacterium]